MFYRVFMGFHGFYRVLLGFTGFCRVVPRYTWFYGFLVGFTEFYRVLFSRNRRQRTWWEEAFRRLAGDDGRGQATGTQAELNQLFQQQPPLVGRHFWRSGTHTVSRVSRSFFFIEFSASIIANNPVKPSKTW